MEYSQAHVNIPENLNTYEPNENEKEMASYSYLMSVVVVLMGMPLPIINVIASTMFYLANRKSGYFIRWHCIQTLVSQLSLVAVNSISFWWTINIFLLNKKDITTPYIAYIIMVVLVNIVEIISTIFTATKVRNGKHVSWWFYGDLTNLICKP